MNQAQAVTKTESQKSCWLLTTGEAGCYSQLKGLAERLGVAYEKKLIHLPFPWKLLPGHLCPWPLAVTQYEGGHLYEPWPDLVLSCGRRTVAAALGIKRASGGKTKAIHIQNPLVPVKEFDAVISPYFDDCKGDNVYETFGAIHHLTQDTINSAVAEFKDQFLEFPHPRIAVLLGGTSRSSRFTDEIVDQLIKDLIDLNKKKGYSYLITPSVRTPPEVLSKIQNALKDLPVYIWDRKPPNPYQALLGLADTIIVTSDSVSMVSESCFTGKPVYLVRMHGGSKRQIRYYKDLESKGFIRWFEGRLDQWSYKPLDETGQAAHFIEKTVFSPK